MLNNRFNTVFLSILLTMLLCISCEEPLQPHYINSFDISSPTYIPTTPSDLRVTINNDSLFTIHWNDQSLNEDGFKLSMKSGNDTVFSLLAILDSNVTSFRDTLTKLYDVVYTYRLHSFSGTKLSKTFSETSTQFSFPAPSITSVSGTDSTQMTIRWQSNTPFPTKTVIEKMGKTAFSIIAVIPPGVNSFTDVSVDKSHSYTYRITSRTNHNISLSSDTIQCGFQITDVSQSRIIETLLTPSSGTYGILSDDGKLFLSVSMLEAAIVDFPSGSVLQRIIFPQPIGIVNGIALSKNKQLFAFAGWHDSCVYVYRVNDGKLLRTFRGRWPGVDVVLTNDGLQVIVSLGYGDIQCWRIADSSLVWSTNARSVSYPDYPLNVASLWLHPDGQKILVGIGTSCRLLDINSGVVLSNSQGGFFLKTPAIVNGEMLVMTTDGICYNITRDITEFITYPNMKSASISTDKNFIVLSRYNNETRIISLVPGTWIYFAQNLFGWQQSASFFDNDRQVLIYNQEGKVGVWQLLYNWDTF